MNSTWRLVLVTICFAPIGFAQPQPAVPRDPILSGLSPEEAAKSMTVPEGFHVKLFAGEPDVIQPIAMALDDRGRLWVAEAYSYPIRVPEEEAKDRILILEDSDGDGRFDSRKIFVEKLNLISGLQIGFGGVYVGAAPNLLFIPDRNGDDQPDGPAEVLLDGWGMEDTHETLNSFIWGPDGWLYGCHGVFTHSAVGKPGTPKEQRTRINAGIWRYHPIRHMFEVFSEGTSNPWGVDFNSKGDAFCTACVIPHLYHLIPGGRYQRQAGNHFNLHTYDDIKTIANHRHWVGNQWNNEDRARSDGNGGGHAHAGAMFYLGGAWPKEYRDRLFMNNIHGSRINQDRLTPKGSGYEGDGDPDFLFANDNWSQILYLTYGPDGQVYMIDWYDKNQCHHGNIPGHDRTNGRIFKICYGEQKSVPVDLKKAIDAELVDYQKHENEWFARHARRLLQERSAAGKLAASTIPLLKKTLDACSEADIRLRLILSLHAAQGLDEAMTLKLLGSEIPNERSWALRLACEEQRPTSKILSRMKSLATEEKVATVRLALASSIQRLPSSSRWEVVEALVAHGEDADDHNLPLMYWYATEPLLQESPERALGLYEKTQIPLVKGYLVRRAASDPEAYDALFALLIRSSETERLTMLDEVVTALKTKADLKQPASWKRAFEVLMKSNDPNIHQRAEYIAVKFGDERVLPKLRETLSDSSLPSDRRKLALESLVSGKDKELPGVLYGLFKDDEFRLPAIQALANFENEQTPEKLLAIYNDLSASDKQAVIVTLTSRVPFVLRLLDAIENKDVPRSDLPAFTVTQLARIDSEELKKRLNEVWGTIRVTPAEKAEEMLKLRRSLRHELTDAHLPSGRALFNKTCATCHTLFGQGQKIAPDLTGSNRVNLEYILENVLDPSAVVGKDYQMTTFETKGGRTVSGIVKQENESTVTIQTPTEVVILSVSDLEERVPTQTSLMPDGLLKELNNEQIRDLIGYLGAPTQIPLPGEAPWVSPKTRIAEGVIEGETLIARDHKGNVGSQDMAPFSLGVWSGNKHLWWTGGTKGDELVLEIPVEKGGKQEVYVALTKAIDYGIVTLAVDDEEPGEAIDLFNDGVVNTLPISLGVHDLEPGKHTLKVKIVGANPNAVKAYMFAIDYVALMPRTEEEKLRSE